MNKNGELPFNSEEEAKKAKKKDEERVREVAGLKDQMIWNLNDFDKKYRKSSLSRRLYAESKDAYFAKGFTRAQEGTEWREKEVRQDVALAGQIHEDRTKEERLANHKRLLRTNQELIDLEAYLKAAYTQKELYTQLEAKKADKIKVQLENQEEIYRFKAIQEATNEFEEQLKVEAAIKKKEYRDFLQDQIIEKHKQKVDEYKKSLECQAFVEDSMQVLDETDKRDNERQKKIQQLKDDIAEFNRSREIWILKEKEKEQEEDRKIKEYLEEKFKKEQHLQEMARKKEEEKLRFHEVVVKTLKESQGKRFDQDRINQILLDEEDRLKEEAKLKAEYDKKIKIRQELRQVFAKQVELKLQSIEEERRLDYEYCQQMLKVQEANSRREELLAKEKQNEKLKYAQELKQTIEQKEKLRQHELYRRINEYHTLINENKAKIKEIDEERLRMLQEHATRLLGFLPKGTVRSTDLPFLDPAVQKFYNYIPPDDIDLLINNDDD